MKKAVCALVLRNGKALCVSRKDDPNDFGLPGGKVDTGETTIEAMEREVFEETGYKVEYVSPMNFVAMDCGFEVTTFLVRVSETRQETDESETGVVAWMDPSILKTGTFAPYNIKALNHFAIVA